MDTAHPEIYTLSLHDALPISTRPDRAPTAVADPDGPRVVQPPAPPVRHAVQEHFAATERFLRPVLTRSEEHTSELQSRLHLVCRLLLEKKKTEQVDQEDLIIT